MADLQTGRALGKIVRRAKPRRSAALPPARHAADAPGRFEPVSVGAGLAATVLTVSTLAVIPQAQARRGLPPVARLPIAIDQSPAYVPQTSCDPTVKPGVAKFRRL